MINIGIIGINGLVGKAIIESLEMFGYDDCDKYVFYFYGTVDNIIKFNNFDKQVRKYDHKYLHFLDYCILAINNESAKEIYDYSITNKLKLIIIDNSSEFRLNPEIPLCIPEINSNQININHLPYMISNPNCVTLVYGNLIPSSFILLSIINILIFTPLISDCLLL
jgi:aspartate-semialdehyde dehydrogenase